MQQRTIFFIFINIALTLWPKVSFALSPLQEKEIRHSKATMLISQSQDRQALKLLKRNLEGDFHRDTVLTLARYFFKKKVITKSFRFYLVLIKNSIGLRLAKAHYNPNLKSNFLRVLEKSKVPKKENLSVILEVAQRYYKTYKDKTLPEEFLNTVLDLSEKYFTVSAHFNFFKGESHLNLAKIDLIRDKIDSALNNLHIAQEFYSSNDRENHFRSKVLSEDIKVLLAEAYMKKGQGDVGLLLMRSLSAQRKIDPAIRTYAKNYLKSLNSSFVNAIFSYGVTNKKNAYQLNSEDYDNFDLLSNRDDLEKKDSLFHSRRLNVFMNRQISDRYSISGSLDLINQSSFSSGVQTPNYTNTELALDFKRFRDDNSILLFSYKHNNLSGRDLASLQSIQVSSSHRIQAAYRWLYKKRIINFEIPMEFSSFDSGRSTNSFALAVSYEPLLTSQWLAPKYYTLLGRRSEGENESTIFDSSFYFQLGLTNKSDITNDWNLITGIDYYLNSNSHVTLDYSEFNFNLMANHKLKIFKGLSINLNYQATKRSFKDPLGTFAMSEFGIGLTYNF